jgi:hypothetical protein
VCHPTAVARPDMVISHGSHAGYEWLVTHNGTGHRCGYTRVPPGHPWHGLHVSRIDATAHKGLSYAEPDVPCGGGGPDKDWWVGFDTSQPGDAPDPKLPVEWVRADGRRRAAAKGVVRTQEYAEAECRRLCEQAAGAAG